MSPEKEQIVTLTTVVDKQKDKNLKISKSVETAHKKPKGKGN